MASNFLQPTSCTLKSKEKKREKEETHFFPNFCVYIIYWERDKESGRRQKKLNVAIIMSRLKCLRYL